MNVKHLTPCLECLLLHVFKASFILAIHRFKDRIQTRFGWMSITIMLAIHILINNTIAVHVPLIQPKNC